MDDLISRQAAIDRINKQREHLKPDIDERDAIGDAAYRVCAEFIERLPSVQPERWIPCSERLPELDESVLATTAWDDITIAWRIGISKWFIHEGNTSAETDDVLAWMPLPELYKGE